MARPCTICTHAQQTTIEEQLFAGKSFRGIARQTGGGLSADAVERHAKNCIPATLAAARRFAQIRRGIHTEDELDRHYAALLKFNLALEAWLSDPDNPDNLSQVPRDSELPVIYTAGQDSAGQPIRRCATLAELLQRIEEKLGIKVVAVKPPSTNMRKLFLEAHAQLLKTLELYGKLHGDFQDRKPDDESMRRDWVGWLRGIAAKEGRDVVELARFAYEHRPESRAALVAEWPEIALASERHQ